MTARLPAIIAKLIPLLASDHDGEVLATVRAIRRSLAGAGLDLHDLTRRAMSGTAARSKQRAKPAKKPKPTSEPATPPSGPPSMSWAPREKVAYCLSQARLRRYPPINGDELSILKDLQRRGGPTIPRRRAAWLDTIFARFLTPSGGRAQGNGTGDRATAG
jgi:hypothetical protein